MEFNKIIVSFLVLTTVGTSSIIAPSTASAAKWHTGTPKTIRGKWKKAKWFGTGKSRFKFYEIATIGKSTFIAQELGDPYSVNHIKYKKIGKHSYLLSGKEWVYSKKTNHVLVVATKHKLKWRTTYPYNNKNYSPILYR